MVELMIGLVLTLAVGGVTYQMLLNNQRVTRSQTEHVGAQDNVRSGALIIANELRDVGYDAITATASVVLGGYAPGKRSDITEMSEGTIKYHSTRGVGFVCAVSNLPPYKVRVYRSSWQAFRTPKATDTLMVYVENASNTATDDAWIHLGIAGPPASVNCPAVGGTIPAGLEFTVTPPFGLPSLATALTAGTNIVLGGPVRLTEVMRMSHYQAADGSWWLGMKSEVVGGDVMQPVVGPLADSASAVQGLSFVYRDANDAVTAVPGNVRSIQIALNGLTAEAIRGEDVHHAAIDTLSMNTRITLRNTLR
jgi:hypothetical protein